mgnify:CR=1 FL=1
MDFDSKNSYLCIVDSWLINQRWQQVCGVIDQDMMDEQYQQLKKTLLKQNAAHLTHYVESLPF